METHYALILDIMSGSFISHSSIHTNLAHSKINIPRNIFPRTLMKFQQTLVEDIILKNSSELPLLFSRFPGEETLGIWHSRVQHGGYVCQTRQDSVTSLVVNKVYLYSVSLVLAPDLQLAPQLCQLQSQPGFHARNGPVP